jgi:molybdate transport system ATP-binding protein
MARPASALVARLVDLGNLFAGVVAEQRPEAGLTLLRWLDHTLEARHAPGFAVGEQVSWTVPSSHVVLHRRDRPSRGERENPVAGRLGEIAVLGEMSEVTMQVEGAGEARITFRLPTHVARRNGLANGVPMAVSLLADGIHLMPFDDATG